jgi:hypothetical protein
MIGRREELSVGLLDKSNPQATPESARVWAIGGAIVFGWIGFFLWLLAWLCDDMPFGFVFFIVPGMIAGGALAGRAIEWQLPADAEYVGEAEAAQKLKPTDPEQPPRLAGT